MGAPLRRSELPAGPRGCYSDPPLISSASWAQWLDDPQPPGILKLKWIEPRHMQYQIRRWDRSHRGEIEAPIH